MREKRRQGWLLADIASGARVSKQTAAKHTRGVIPGQHAVGGLKEKASEEIALSAPADLQRNDGNAAQGKLAGFETAPSSNQLSPKSKALRRQAIGENRAEIAGRIFKCAETIADNPPVRWLRDRNGSFKVRKTYGRFSWAEHRAVQIRNALRLCESRNLGSVRDWVVDVTSKDYPRKMLGIVPSAYVQLLRDIKKHGAKSDWEAAIVFGKKSRPSMILRDLLRDELERLLAPIEIEAPPEEIGQAENDSSIMEIEPEGELPF